MTIPAALTAYLRATGAARIVLKALTRVNGK